MEMRVVNQNKETITEFDLNKGRLIHASIIRPDAVPIGTTLKVEKDGKFIDKKKICWATEDYEEVLMYVPNKEINIEQKINDLKSKLSATDYKIIKCSEYQLLGYELPYDILTLHQERQSIRDQINLLEMEE